MSLFTPISHTDTRVINRHKTNTHLSIKPWLRSYNVRGISLRYKQNIIILRYCPWANDPFMWWSVGISFPRPCNDHLFVIYITPHEELREASPNITVKDRYVGYLDNIRIHEPIARLTVELWDNTKVVLDIRSSRLQVNVVQR